MQKPGNRICNDIMQIGFIREIRKQAIVLGTHKHRDSALGPRKLAHQLANFLQVDIDSNGTHERAIFFPKRIRIRKYSLFCRFIDFRTCDGKPLMPGRFKVPSPYAEFLFALVQLKVPSRNILAILRSIVNVYNKRRRLQMLFQHLLDIGFFCMLQNFRKRLELLFQFSEKQFKINNDLVLEFRFRRTVRR